jgi:diguanylate cyclase (GGDEF)-like protein
VFRSGTIWATLALISHVAGVFDRDTIALCTSAAELLGRGLDELDLRQRLVEQESREAHRARHDALTGLPNRLALLQELPQAIARAQRHGTQLAVGMIDLDDFKPVNDTFGHATGDEVLRQLAGRMQSLLRVPDLVVRWGGDEFVIVLEDLDPPTVMSQLQAALDRLHAAVGTPFDLGNGHSASLRMSLGVALFPDDGHEANALLRQADAAMYTTKARKAERERWWALSAGTPGV